MCMHKVVQWIEILTPSVMVSIRDFDSRSSGSSPEGSAIIFHNQLSLHFPS